MSLKHCHGGSKNDNASPNSQLRPLGVKLLELALQPEERAVKGQYMKKKKGQSRIHLEEFGH